MRRRLLLFLLLGLLAAVDVDASVRFRRTLDAAEAHADSPVRIRAAETAAIAPGRHDSAGSAVLEHVTQRLVGHDRLYVGVA